jgi:NADP-dependent 3-hydroxy acid dehydrogenase YdfG
MLQSVKNQIIVITGGSSGFGKATAQLFAKEGAKVIITGRDEKTLAQTVAEIGGIEAFRADATRWEDWQ